MNAIIDGCDPAIGKDKAIRNNVSNLITAGIVENPNGNGQKGAYQLTEKGKNESRNR